MNVVTCGHCPGKNHTRLSCAAMGCNADACRAEQRAYQRERKALYRRVRPKPTTWVDADPVRRHLRELSALGIGYRRVAAAAGVHPRRLAALSNPDVQTTFQLARAVLAVRAEHCVPGHHDPAATQARIRWLIDQGASHLWISEQAGLHHATIDALAAGDRVRVVTATVDAVARLARRVAAGDVQPPNYADARRRQLQRERRRSHRRTEVKA